MLHYCVIGFPVHHSLSPKVHNAAFRSCKIRARYVKEEVPPKELGNFMRSFREKYAGANVTIPHKEAIIPFLDKVSPEARKIRAVNTIVNQDGLIIGYNTDVDGVPSMVEFAMSKPLRSSHPIIIGAGGAARAVAYVLKKMGVRPRILNRTLSHAKKLAEDFSCGFGKLDDFKRYIPGCRMIINATSVGMFREGSSSYKRQTPLPGLLEFLRRCPLSEPKPVVLDIIYRPRMTKLLRDAKKAGCRVVTGDLLFLAQAKRSFELWTGKKTPRNPIFSKIQRP
ncbi:shikimate dehydrogenase [Candidatus Peregrinibacteria bacterium]|nr:shikimate dehydrogenase [Candidatus Peregrinibacteria bacterium]